MVLWLSKSWVLFQIDTDEDKLIKSKQLDCLGITLRIQASKTSKKGFCVLKFTKIHSELLAKLV